MIVNAFKNGIFPLVPSDYTSDDDRGLRPDSPTFLVLVLLISLIKKSLKKMFEFLKHKKGTLINKIKITLIKSRLRDLKNDIKNMSENELKNKKLDLLADLVEKILDINKQLNMLELETEESAEQRRNQQGQGLKI